jgi:LacI family transcriptional regulator
MPHPARGTVTLHDVAAAAGVSLATASRVLGGSSRTVAPEYRERVLAVAEQLRYTADASARAMRRVSDSLALLADDLTTPSMAIMVSAMERQARTTGAFVTVSATRGDPERQLEAIRRLRALRPRALVLTSGRIDVDALSGRLLAELRTYERGGGRVVVVGDTDMPFHSVKFDNHGAASLLGRHVADSGHRRIAIIAGADGQAAPTARTAGFLAGLRAGGVDASDVRIVHCAMSRDGGFEAAQGLIAAGLIGARPDGEGPDGARLGGGGPGAGPGGGGLDAAGRGGAARSAARLGGAGPGAAGPVGAGRGAGRSSGAGLDAILAVNDLIAVGALRALREAGVAVPDDVSLTGFDDIRLAMNVTPRLTTVALPLAYAGAEAIRLALESGPVTHVTVEGHLVVRESTRTRALPTR